jgi:2-polyprenyl-6-methoxyphenol hydroxylase-like FAD-dependent oxidoreductase
MVGPDHRHCSLPNVGDWPMLQDTVLIAGGGIAGLALARALQQRDVPFEVVERSPGRGAGGLAINLPGNAITAFAALGVGEGLARLGRPTRRREYRTDKGRLLFAVDEDTFWGPDAQPRCVRRSDLLALLAEDVKAQRPATVESVRTVPPGAEVTFGGGERQTYGFVAAADGVRSAVRTSVFGGDGVREALLSAASWRFMAPNPGVDCWTAWAGDASALMLIPVDGDEVYAYASATRGGPIGADPSWLQETFRSYPAPVRQVVESVAATPQALHHSPITEVRAGRWAQGRCVLVGDAAHATAPVWAQGGALAAEDALVLAGLLAAGDWDTAGARYQELRRARVTHVQAATDRFSKSAGLPAWLRNIVAPLLGTRTYRDAYGPLREPVTQV